MPSSQPAPETADENCCTSSQLLGATTTTVCVRRDADSAPVRAAGPNRSPSLRDDEIVSVLLRTFKPEYLQRASTYKRRGEVVAARDSLQQSSLQLTSGPSTQAYSRPLTGSVWTAPPVAPLQRGAVLTAVGLNGGRQVSPSFVLDDFEQLIADGFATRYDALAALQAYSLSKGFTFRVYGDYVPCWRHRACRDSTGLPGPESPCKCPFAVILLRPGAAGRRKWHVRTSKWPHNHEPFPKGYQPSYEDHPTYNLDRRREFRD